jgi:hypothetical protein
VWRANAGVLEVFLLKGRKVFFSEEKKQKTFTSPPVSRAAMTRKCEAARK